MLRQIGLEFVVDVPRVEENAAELRHMPPGTIALELAKKKVRQIADKYQEAVILGADTIVVLAGRILGKPNNEAQAKEMLAMLSGRTHEVFTGFAILKLPEQTWLTDVERTAVTFRTLSEQEIEDYIRTGHPMDKAGAYGIQDESAVFVEKIEGCFYNVVGFPLSRFYQVCKANFLTHNEE